MKNQGLLNKICIRIHSAPDPDPNPFFGFGSTTLFETKISKESY